METGDCELGIVIRRGDEGFARLSLERSFFAGESPEAFENLPQVAVADRLLFLRSSL